MYKGEWSLSNYGNVTDQRVVLLPKTSMIIVTAVRLQRKFEREDNFYQKFQLPICSNMRIEFLHLESKRFGRTFKYSDIKCPTF